MHGAVPMTTTTPQKQHSSNRNEIQSKHHNTTKDDNMAKRRMRKPVVDSLILSTSSGYSTASEEAEPQHIEIAPTILTATAASLTHPSASASPSTDNKITAVSAAPQKSSKRKTRAPTAPIAPSQKRLKVESITNYNCNTATSTSTAAAPSSSSSSMHSIDGRTVLSSKPPLPPKATNSNHGSGDTRSNQLKTKRHSENQKQTALLNKLSSYADQCRLEIADLKLALANEKAAVRSLR